MMERLINFEPAFDQRNPDPSKNRGIHGVEVRFVLKGELGAMQFVIFTDWHLPEALKHVERQERLHGFRSRTMGADVGYHSPKPMYEDQVVITEPCPYLDGKPCYYDGSGLQADAMFQELIREGDTAVWTGLERRYVELFGELR